MPKKKTKIGLWILVLISVVVIIGAIIFIFSGAINEGEDCKNLFITNAEFPPDDRFPLSSAWYRDCDTTELDFDKATCDDLGEGYFDTSSGKCIIVNNGCFVGVDTNNDDELEYFTNGGWSSGLTECTTTTKLGDTRDGFSVHTNTLSGSLSGGIIVCGNTNEMGVVVFNTPTDVGILDVINADSLCWGGA